MASTPISLPLFAPQRVDDSAGLAARPAVSKPYVAKVRILTTTACPHKCPFCHNEGQPQLAGVDLDPIELAPYVPILRRFSPRVTLSGGEPMACQNLEPLVDLLVDHDFEVTIDTAGANLLEHSAVLSKIASLHVSVISLDPADRLSSCNGVAATKLSDLASVRESFPLLRLTINVPVVAGSRALEQLSEYLQIARSLNARLKLIGEIKPRLMSVSRLMEWPARWHDVRSLLQRSGFRAVASDERSIEYVDDTGVHCDASDIACVKVGPEYAGGRCFANMDVTITSDLRVRLCRWQENGIPLSRATDDGSPLADVLDELVQMDAESCPHGIVLDPVARRVGGRLLVEEHGRWPITDEEDLNHLSGQLQDAVRRGAYSYFGREGAVRRFESALASFFEVPYALTFNSGTAALLAAYCAAGLQDGGELVLPDLSYPGALAAALLIGAQPVLCDVDPLTGVVDRKSLASAISDRTKAVVVTHLWGEPVDIKGIRSVLAHRPIVIIEDASHAPGGRSGGQMIGTIGDIGCFSLQANKSLQSGEGGVAVTQSAEHYEAMTAVMSLQNRILDHVTGDARRFWYSGLGAKLKLHPLAAHIGLDSLAALPSVRAQRAHRFARIAALLEGVDAVLVPGAPSENDDPSYYRPKVVLGESVRQQRDRILYDAMCYGARVARPSWQALHETELWKDRAGSRGRTVADLLGASDYLGRTISLPNLTADPSWLADRYGEAVRLAVLRASESRALRT